MYPVYAHRHRCKHTVILILKSHPSTYFDLFPRLMLVFSQSSGRLEAILLDEGLLTELRTAAAGALAAKLFARPDSIDTIGIVGSGIQARWQLRLLRTVTPCRRVLVYSRNRSKCAAFSEEMRQASLPLPNSPFPNKIESLPRKIITLQESAIKFVGLFLSPDVVHSSHDDHLLPSPKAQSSKTSYFHCICSL